MIEFVHELQRRQFAVVAPTASPQWQTWLLMLALSLAVYLPAACRAELLMFDDRFFFGPDNAEFVAGWKAVATQPIANAYLPVAHLSLWFDYKVGGGGALLPHVHALLVHAIAAVVLARLLLQLGVGRVSAHVVAALFVVHPALCESVAWVSSRKYVLSGLFTFLALFQTVRFAHAPSLVRAVALAVLAAAAMFSNATSVVLPILSVGVVMWSQGPSVRWLAPAVLFATTIPIALYHQQVAAAQGTLVVGEVMQRLQQAPGAFWHYLCAAVWPTRLNVLYPEVDTLAAFREHWLPGTVALASFFVVGAAGWFWRSTRAFGAGLLAFCVALLPFNTAFPASAIAAADRYLYLAIPGLGLAIVAASGLLHRRGPWVAALLPLPLLWLASNRVRDFENETVLWQASLAVAAENAVAHINLAYEQRRAATQSRRELSDQEAERYEAHLRSAVRAARYGIHELRARRSLQQILMQRADYEEAAANALAAIAAAKRQLAQEVSAIRIAQSQQLLHQVQLDAFEPLQLSGEEETAAQVLAEVKAAAPDSPDVIAFQAMLDLAARRPELLELARRGKSPRLSKEDPGAAAVDAVLEAARAQHKQHAGLCLAQALWHKARHNTSKAIRYFDMATKLKPTLVAAWLSSARMMREERMYDSALTRAQNGWLFNKDPQLLQEVALSLVGLNRLDEAQEYLSAYVRLRPDDRDSGKILSNLLIGRALQLLSDNTKRETVRKLVADALRYNPDETKAHLVLGRLAHQEREFEAAVYHMEKAVALLPGYADARAQLTQSLAALGWAAVLQKNDNQAADAWLRCLEVAPKDFADADSIRRQLGNVWDRIKERGIQHHSDGKIDEAVDDYRLCLRIDPDRHLAAWLLAMALRAEPDVDLAELEDLCRKSVAWQKANERDPSQQVYLLAITLQRKGDEDGAQKIAEEYMRAPHQDADPAVLRALQRLADS